MSISMSLVEVQHVYFTYLGHRLESIQCYIYHVLGFLKPSQTKGTFSKIYNYN
jgi:hypothetical protein